MLEIIFDIRKKQKDLIKNNRFFEKYFDFDDCENSYYIEDTSVKQRKNRDRNFLFVKKNMEDYIDKKIRDYFFDQYFEKDFKREEWERDKKSIKEIGKIVCDYEKELVDLWEKPKIAHSCQYVISLSELEAGLKEEVLEKIPKEQKEEWGELGFTDNDQHRPIDTKHFDDDLKYKILSSIDNIEDKTSGILIESDNWQALNTIKNRFGGKVKSIYLDPPYNTKNNEFAYYDNYKRSSWLTMMKNRLDLAKEFLSDDGVIFVSIDDNEQAYLKVLMDEIFGGENFIGDLIRKTRSSNNDKSTGFNIQHENCLIYGYVFLRGEVKTFEKYSNPDNDPLGDWCSGDPTAKSGKEDNIFPVENPHTKQIDYPPRGRYWVFTKNTIQAHIDSGRIKFRKNKRDGERGFTWKRYRNNLKSSYHLINSLDFANNDYMNQVATKYLNSLNILGFDNSKPEIFIDKIFQYSSEENDLTLDFFLGSGTSSAVAHKMGRKYIGIEANSDIFRNVIIPRMKKVLAGEQGGISEKENWKGGGMLKYYQIT